MLHKLAVMVVSSAVVFASTKAFAAGNEGCDPPCREGFVCRGGACISACNPPCPEHYVCQQRRCVPMAPAAVPAASAGSDPLSGIHFFAGISTGAGFSAFWPEHQIEMQFRGAGHFSLRTGALLNRLEVALELAPVSYYPGEYVDQMFGMGSKLNLNLTIGYLAKITDRFHWPLRFGGGMMTVNTATVFGMLRFDLLGFGMSFPVGPGVLLLDLALPSLRFFSELEHLGIWSWIFNLQAVYVL